MYSFNFLTSVSVLNMKKILIAEDNDSNYLLMTYLLKGHYTLERARDGVEAVMLTRRNKYDLVLMDLKMPRMDGLEATRQIKLFKPELPVVALTANVFEVDRKEAVEAGCAEFLTKPITAEVCIATIEKFTR